MGSELVIGGVTFPTSLVKALPAISGLLSLEFFGTGGDGVNTNRAPGGPAVAPVGAGPTYSTNFGTVGLNGVVASGAVATLSGNTVGSIATPTTPGTNYTSAPIVNINGGGGTGAAAHATIAGGAITGVVVDAPGTGYTSAPTIVFAGGNNTGLDLGTPRSAILTSGWTIAAVVRVPASGGPTVVATDQTTVSFSGFIATLQLQNVSGTHSGSPTLSFFSNSTEGSFIVLPSSAATNWRFVACTYAGTGTGDVKLYSVSDILTGGAFTQTGFTAGASQQFKFGPSAFNNTGNTADISFGMMTSGPLSLATLQGIYASVKTILARRNLVVL